MLYMLSYSPYVLPLPAHGQLHDQIILTLLIKKRDHFETKEWMNMLSSVYVWVYGGIHSIFTLHA